MTKQSNVAPRVRKSFFASLAIVAASLSSCTTKVAEAKVSDVKVVSVTRTGADTPSSLEAVYAAVEDDGKIIPAVDVSKMDSKNVRQVVDYKTKYPPGTIVVDPHNRYLYLVMPNAKAMRYGVGVARAGLEFTGEATVTYKRHWPSWTPTESMIRRNPEHYAKYAGGLEGGLHNPLGARAFYLFQGGEDTLYRIHGTDEPWSIGKAASSGCIRLLNQDIIDLHRRVPDGARVVVLGSDEKQGDV